jgi:4-amino-4-deoxy-L-arabinose transferase-like glycosyltransferase
VVQLCAVPNVGTHGSQLSPMTSGPMRSRRRLVLACVWFLPVWVFCSFLLLRNPAWLLLTTPVCLGYGWWAYNWTEHDSRGEDA